MGVQGLLTFLKSNNLGEDVKLADIAAEYRKKTGKRPVLLVDSSSCLPIMHPGKLNTFAAELKKFKETCQEFLNRFHDLNIQLHIIENGLKSEIKIQSWVKGKDETIECLDSAYRARDITLAKFRGGFLYRIAMEVFTLSDKCEFRRSNYEATHYIAQYLKANGAFGVLSNDSDIVLMEGSHYFLSIEDLKLSEMTTFNFNRDKLAEFLKIKAQLLPYVGTLCPNGILNQNDLKKFFSKYCKNTYKSRKFEVVADVVKKNLSDFDPGEYLAKDLCRYHRSKLCLDEHQLEKYMKRLKILNGYPDEESEGVENKHWNDILTLAETLHRGGHTDRHVLELLLKKRFFSGIEFENVNMPTPGEELQNLRRKIYGFLFSEYPKKVSVTEHLYSFQNNRTIYGSCEVTFERRDHVGLLELWSADAPEDIQKKKYKYFFGIINEKLDPDILLGKVEEEFVFPLLATFYLHCELRKFSSFFTDMFLLHSVLANKSSASEIPEFDCEPDFDAFNLCAWYLRVIEHLELVNSVCGNPFDRTKTNFVNYVDGLLLQTICRDIKCGKVIPKELLPTFKLLKTVLTEMKQCC